jgi:hypothetical protein
MRNVESLGEAGGDLGQRAAGKGKGCRDRGVDASLAPREHDMTRAGLFSGLVEQRASLKDPIMALRTA